MIRLTPWDEPIACGISKRSSAAPVCRATQAGRWSRSPSHRNQRRSYRNPLHEIACQPCGSVRRGPPGPVICSISSPQTWTAAEIRAATEGTEQDTGDAKERTTNQYRYETDESGDLEGPPEYTGRGDVVLELLINQTGDDHDDRLFRSLGQRQNGEDDRRNGRAYQWNGIENESDDRRHQGRGQPESGEHRKREEREQGRIDELANRISTDYPDDFRGEPANFLFLPWRKMLAKRAAAFLHRPLA